MKTQIILFAGTSEGRRLAKELQEAGAGVLLCVATPYGEELARQLDGVQVRSGRMDSAAMAVLLRGHPDALVVDATHPYAREVTQNIRAACAQTGLAYHRLARDAAALGDAVTVSSMAEAAEVLAGDGGRALLTVGSKELEHFCAVPRYQERLFPRVLPMAESLEKCLRLGYPGRQLILMQGPFSHALNLAMLRQVKADWLVTKDSGEAGGLGEKRSAAKEAGARLLVIGRMSEEQGYPYGELRSLLARRLALTVKPNTLEQPLPTGIPRLPLFVDILNQPVLVAGAGKVASRRVHTLLTCGARVTVIAPEAESVLSKMAAGGKITLCRRSYTAGDLELTGSKLAVAATDDTAVNLLVAREAEALGIPCSVAHDRHQGSFWFPALVQRGSLVAGLASTDGDHGAVRREAENLRKGLWQQWLENLE